MATILRPGFASATDAAGYATADLDAEPANDDHGHECRLGYPRQPVYDLDEARLFRGIMIAGMISVPIWGLIGWLLLG